MGNGMALFYVQAIGHLPICMLWICNGASHGECQGCALWVLQWDVPMGSPWNCIGNSPCEIHGLVLWVMHLDYPHGHSMELPWEFSWGMAWHCSMCKPLGICPYACYGFAMVLLMGNAKDVLYGYFSGMSPWAAHGIALGILHVNSMGLFFG